MHQQYKIAEEAKDEILKTYHIGGIGGLLIAIDGLREIIQNSLVDLKQNSSEK